MLHRLVSLSVLLVLPACGDDGTGGGGLVLTDAQDRTNLRDASVVVPGQGGAGGDVVDPEPGAGGAGGSMANLDPDAGGSAGAGGGGRRGCVDGTQQPCPDACGVQRCVLDTWGPCEEAVERCDDADNDCDGLVDENFPALGIGCQVLQGACQAGGLQVCNADGNGVTCLADPVAPEAEVCDGLDNDCDNDVDEDFPGQFCCTEDVHCPPGDRCTAGTCEVGGPVGPRPGGGGGGGGCASALNLAAFGRYAGDNSQGSMDLFGECGGLFGPESVFSFTLDMAQRVRLDTEGSFADTILSVSTDCGDPLSEVACDDDGGGGLTSALEFDALAGVRYFVAVDTSLLPGPFVLNFGAAPAAPPPPAGACDDVVEMAAFGEYRGTTVGRPNQMAAQSCQRNTGGGELAFTFVPEAAGQVTLDASNSSFDTVLSVRTDCADAATEVACNDDAVGVRSRVQFQAQAGVRYHAVVDGYDGESGAVVLSYDGVAALDACMAPEACGAGRQCMASLCVPLTPAACAGAVAAEGPGPFQGTTEGRVHGLAGSCDPQSTAPEAIYAFVSPVAGAFVASTTGSAFDTVLYVLDGCVNSVACNDDAVGVTSSVTFNAAAGRVYYIVVDGYRNASGAYQLTVRHQ